MSEYYYQGEKYYFSKGRWLDSKFGVVPIVISSQLNYCFGKRYSVNRKYNRACKRANPTGNIYIHVLPGCFGAGKRQ